MGRWVTEDEYEEVYGLAEVCVRQYAEYQRQCHRLIVRWADAQEGARPSTVSEAELKELDEAMAELGVAAERLGEKLLPIRRALHARSRGVVELLDIDAPTLIEAVLRLTRREGKREPWTGRLDLQSDEDRKVLGQTSGQFRQDRDGMYYAGFAEERILSELDIEAGRVIESVSGEFDHILRILDRQPRRFLELLIHRRGRVVDHTTTGSVVCGDEDANPNTIYRARNRLKNALIKAGFGELDDRIESIEGGYCLT